MKERRSNQSYNSRLTRQLRQYAQRRPLPYDKTTEKKIAFHSKELKKKYRGDIKIRHRQADNTSGVLSAKSNISKAMLTRKISKPHSLTSRSRKSSATPNTSAAYLSRAQRPRKAKEIDKLRIIRDSRAQSAL